MSDKLQQISGCSAVLVARLNGVQEAVSSILATRTIESNDFTLEIVGFFFIYGLASFGFDHNFDHNTGGYIATKNGQPFCGCPPGIWNGISVVRSYNLYCIKLPL